MRWIIDTADLARTPEPSVAGLAACLALLEREARMLGHPLVAMLLAAAGEELRQLPSAALVSDPAGPRPG